MGEKQYQPFQLLFNASLKVDFQGSRAPSAEQGIKEGKQATHSTRLSCHRFRADEARVQFSLLAYNLGNLWRHLLLPKRVDAWSLTSLRQRLVKTGGRRVKHAGYYWLLLAEGHLHRRLFGHMLQRIYALPVPSGKHSDCGCKIWGRGRRVKQCLNDRLRSYRRDPSDGKNVPSEPASWLRPT